MELGDCGQTGGEGRPGGEVELGGGPGGVDQVEVGVGEPRDEHLVRSELEAPGPSPGEHLDLRAGSGGDDPAAADGDRLDPPPAGPGERGDPTPDDEICPARRRSAVHGERGRAR